MRRKTSSSLWTALSSTPARPMSFARKRSATGRLAASISQASARRREQRGETERVADIDPGDGGGAVMALRVVCYVNQFFGQLGGEEKAGVGPHVVDGVFFFQAEDGIRDKLVTGVQTCALPI